jgi:predicted nucleotidyltransferase
VERLRRAARSIKPAQEFKALHGSWARGEATEASDLDVAVIADGAGDREALFEALDEWSGLAKHVTGRVPSVVIADDSTQTRGVLWDSIRRDSIVLIDDGGADHDE